MTCQIILACLRARLLSQGHLTQEPIFLTSMTFKSPSLSIICISVPSCCCLLFPSGPQLLLGARLWVFFLPFHWISWPPSRAIRHISLLGPVCWPHCLHDAIPSQFGSLPHFVALVYDLSISEFLWKILL